MPIEKLITKSPDSKIKRAIHPANKRAHQTITQIYFEELIRNPYGFTEEELRHRVHVELRKRRDLKLKSYSIKRSELLKKYGWGLHVDSAGRLALVGCDGKRYKELTRNPRVLKISGYRTRKA